MSPTSGWDKIDAGDRVGLGRDVGLWWVQCLGDRALRRLHRGPEALQSFGQALRERAAEATTRTATRLRPCRRPAASAAAAAAAGEAAVGLDARLDLRLLLGSRRVDLLVDLHLIATGLHLGDDLGNRALLVLRDEGEPSSDRVDARQRRDRLGFGVGEGELGRGQEEVVHEVIAGIAELATGR